jgi:hypothetical protein
VPEPCAVETPEDYTTELPAISRPPVLDGAVDCGLGLQAIPVACWYGEGSGPPPGFAARFAAAWHATGLYVVVEVDDLDRYPAPPDDPPWQGDAVEVFVDDDASYTSPPTYDDPGSVQLVASAPVDVVAEPHIGARFVDSFIRSPWRAEAFGSFPTASGYRLEAFVQAQDLGLDSWSLVAGGRVGFTLALDASTADGSASGFDGVRQGQFFLPGSCGRPLPPANVLRFLAPILLAP